MAALLHYLTSQRAELRAEASARLVELGGVALPLLQAAADKAKDTKKAYYQQIIDELGATSATTTGSLLAALTAVRRSDPTHALQELRAWWEQTRSPQAREILEKLQNQIPRPTQSFRTPKEADAWWEGVARKKNPAELGWILPTLVTHNHREVKMRLELLAEWPPDPRIADAAMSMMEIDPFGHYSSADGTYRAAVGVLSAMGDATVLPRLVDWKKWQTNWPFLSKPGQEAFAGVGLKAAIEALRPRAITAEEEDQLAELARLVGQARVLTREEFLAEIYADPENDAPRLVYADWLSEQSDPRGEFISLQIARARGEGTPEGLVRERELLEKYAVAWDQENASNQMSKVEYRRGFPYSVGLSWNTGELAPLLACAAWSTVESLRIYDGLAKDEELDQILSAHPFRSVRKVQGAEVEKLPKTYPQILSVAEHRGMMIDLDAFPNLQEVFLRRMRRYTYARVERAAEATLINEEHQRLQTLDQRNIKLVYYRTSLHDAHRILGFSPENLTEIVIHQEDYWSGDDGVEGWVTRLERGTKGTLSVVTATLVSRAAIADLHPILNNSSEEAIERLTIVLEGTYRFDTNDLSKLINVATTKPKMTLVMPIKWKTQLASRHDKKWLEEKFSWA